MLSHEEKIRYSRQTALQRIGEEGQLALKKATVIIIGLGGLGNPVSLYLNAAGVGNIYLIDGDQVDSSNLPRQVLFNEKSIGLNKADCAGELLKNNNTSSHIEMIDEMLDEELADYYFPFADIVLDCTDNINSRYLINQKCQFHNKPLLIASATGFDGQLFFFDPNDSDSACYQCVLPKKTLQTENNCQTLGILGPVLSVIGGMQALETLKYLTGNFVKTNQLSLFDGANSTWQQFSVIKQVKCPICQ